MLSSSGTKQKTIQTSVLTSLSGSEMSSPHPRFVHNVVTHVRKSNPYGRPVHIFYHFQLSCIALFSCYRSICFLACVGFLHQRHFRRAVRTSDRFSRNGPARTSIEGRCLQTHFLGPCAQVRSVVFAVSCLVDVLGHPAADWR